MSRPKTIGAHLTRKTSNDCSPTRVRFAETRIGEFEVVIAAENRPADGSQVSEELIDRMLVQEGLIQLPANPRSIHDNFTRIDVGGIPVSETIIEERR